MSADNESSSIAEELSKLEKICQRAAQDLSWKVLREANLILERKRKR